MATYYKKLVSLNPNEWKTISNYGALKGYKNYVQTVLKSPYSDKVPKTFNDWLKTEI